MSSWSRVRRHRGRAARIALGVGAALAATAALSAVMLPLRGQLSVATTALVLVVPVVIGVAVGGFGAGAVATVLGFLTYDFVFIPPYGTLSVGSAQNWTALGVYAVVMVVVSRVFDRLEAARAQAEARAAELRRLFDVSDLLVRDSSPAALLEGIVRAVRLAFELEGAALLLPAEGTLALAASSGAALSEAELTVLSTGARPPAGSRLSVVALVASGRPAGLLALRGAPGESGTGADLLRAFSNHLALALERSQLQEQALRAGVLEEVDRLRRGLIGAVSHDLRTPLATIKVATSTLLDPCGTLPDSDARELLELVDGQADRLDRLVANLLDMTRIHAGALALRRAPVALRTLLDDALGRIGPSLGRSRVRTQLADDLPALDVDRVLVGSVLANLLDNALRYSPADKPVTVAAAARRPGLVAVTVSDHGPGLAAGPSGAGVFESLGRREAGGAGGLGLAIVQAFVEAHGQQVWVENVEGGGGRVCFTLPAPG
jgi:two-component system sensor histidine kinase KdpD